MQNDADDGEFARLRAEGWALIKIEVVFADQPRGELTQRLRRQLEKAEELFQKALQLKPESSGCLWAIGKIRDRLEDYERAFDYFARSSDRNRADAEAPRDAALAAQMCGKGDEAVSYSLRALGLKPDDAGLRANLAMSYLIQGNLPLAREAAANAVLQSPGDTISRQVLGLIEDVTEGRRARPTTLRGLREL